MKQLSLKFGDPIVIHFSGGANTNGHVSSEIKEVTIGYDAGCVYYVTAMVNRREHLCRFDGKKWVSVEEKQNRQFLKS